MTPPTDHLPDDPTPAVPSFRAPLIFSVALAAALAVLAAWAWQQVPAGARIPTHWDAAGRPNGYGGRNSLFLLPAIVLGLGLLFYAMPHIEPRRGHLLRSSRAYRSVWLATVVFLAGLHLFVVRMALGRGQALPPQTLSIGLGALLIVIGNFLGKIRSNFIFGVRTPWTLSSELSWNKTHRLAGWLFVAGGLAEMAGGFLGCSGRQLNALLLGWVGAMLVTVLVYSYLVWRSDPDKAVSRRA
jgi:uncharacterized membrane protein